MDVLYKGVAFDDSISVTVIESTGIVNEAIKLHNLSPLAAAALGRALTACTFMSSTLKSGDDRVSVTINGDGVGGQIVVAGNSSLFIRGYIDNPGCDLPLNKNGKLDVAGCVGKGKITVVRSNSLKAPYVGSCEIKTGEIAEDFAAYYTYSEQQPTGMALGVKIGTDLSCLGAGGVIFQTLPGADPDIVDKAEDFLLTLTDISSIMEKDGALEFVKKAFTDFKYEVFTPQYKCICSKEYIDAVLLSLGKKELYNTIMSEGEIKVHCHFCNKDYVYHLDDLDRMFEN